MINSNIQSTAQISPAAQLAENVEVGHYAIIGPEVKIAEGTRIGDHCVITGNTAIGKNCQIFTGAVIGSVPQDLKYKGEKTELIIGDDNIIREYVTINMGTAASDKTIIGNGNLIMAYAHIAHDCVIGNNVILANVGTLAGHIVIEDKAILGGLAAVHQFVRIGRLAIVGGCSKVIQDIPPYSMCDGHPAKVRSLNRVGLERAGINHQARVSLKSAFTILFNSGLTIPNALKKVETDIMPCPEVTHLINFIKNSQRGVCR
ncbi:MAG: acyl-ACP--UDP-N-acetylglucosamine O-acyltransferase [Candidatus Omnitrophota bacterium]|nr:MAG: acyl-ACP--UDP-N-acetylglucosamine O-acyltransferase [Candidatus Omnitrophota bacterium]